MLESVRKRGIDPASLYMVGDQLLKDVCSAKRAGAKSVLVPRRGSEDHLGVRLVQRPAEALMRLSMVLDDYTMPIYSSGFPDELVPVKQLFECGNAAEGFQYGEILDIPWYGDYMADSHRLNQ